MSSVPPSDFSFTHPLQPSKNPFSEVQFDIVHADTLDPLLRHDDVLAAQERERKNRYGDSIKRKRALGDDGDASSPGPSLTKPKLKKKNYQGRGISEMPSAPAMQLAIERTNSKSRAASSPPVVHRHTEINGFLCESINPSSRNNDINSPFISPKSIYWSTNINKFQC